MALVGGTVATKVLVVDDDVEIADSICSYGRAMGYEVISANGAQLALELAKSEAPDAILLDIGLADSDGDGRDVMVELNRQKITDHAVVIFVTGRDSQTDRVLGLELGADDYVTKPINFEHLYRKVDHLLEKKRG